MAAELHFWRDKSPALAYWSTAWRRAITKAATEMMVAESARRFAFEDKESSSSPPEEEAGQVVLPSFEMSSFKASSVSCSISVAFSDISLYEMQLRRVGVSLIDLLQSQMIPCVRQLQWSRPALRSKEGKACLSSIKV